VKIKGNEKYEFCSIQLQCHSTSHSTQPIQPITCAGKCDATQTNPTQPKPTHGWTQPMSISARLYFLRTDWLQRNWGGWCSVSSCAVTTAPLQCTSTLLELSSVQFMCCEQTFSSDSQDAIILSDNVSSCCISSNTRVTMPRPYAALRNTAICPSVRLSVCLSHALSSKTAHFTAMVTIEH